MSYINANELGFLPGNSGLENRAALQQAVDRGGNVSVDIPGEYKLAGTVYVGSNTTLSFGNGVIIKKVDENGWFCHVLLNKGALTRTYDEHIRIENLHIQVNGIDCTDSEVMGLRGHLAFFYVRDLVIEGFRCHDLDKSQFAIHICTFEDIIVRNAIIEGDKDGVHLGTGRRFYIGNCAFRTFDDAVALNAQDYDNCNPELGWIEDGVVENCHDLDDGHERKVGFFARCLAGGWRDWYEGMEVQKSDTVVSEGKLYRVRAEADGRKYISMTKPDHAFGAKVIDEINWFFIQDDAVYNAGVRNVVFRNIFLRKPRIGFAAILERNKFNRSYYKGADIPVQNNFVFENIMVLHDGDRPFIEVSSPLECLNISNSSLGKTRIQFYEIEDVEDYMTTNLNVTGCTFDFGDINEVLDMQVPDKIVITNESANTFLNKVKPE